MYFHDKKKNVFVDLGRLQMLRISDRTKLFDCDTGEYLILSSDAKNGHTYIAKTSYYLEDGMYNLAEFDNKEEAYTYMNMLINKIKESIPVIENVNNEDSLLDNGNNN